MQEKLLHFLWQYQYYSPEKLEGTQGEKIQVLQPGIYNENAGPDFLHSQLLINGLEWQGHVEIHTRASDWKQHRHDQDQVYNSVILHVVWENDVPAFRADDSPIHTVELAGKVPGSVIRRYQDLSQSLWHIACADSLPNISSNTLNEAKKTALIERMRTKADEILQRVKENRGDWEYTAYQWMLRYFGFGKNAHAFDRLSQMLPFRVLLRHRDHPMDVDALLFGAAGFLDGPPVDSYHRRLKSEFSFLKDKYGLKSMPVMEWQFLRMRPANFPTVRIAQMSALMSHRNNLFSFVMDCNHLEDVYDFFNLPMSDYWLEHYRFGKKSKSKLNKIGKEAVQLIVINVLAPLRAAYRLSLGQPRWFEAMEGMLHQLPSENNKYIRLWKAHGITCHNALDSQGYLAQYLLRCQDKKCLSCPVGREILNKSAWT
jgi:hypothetical protein